MATIKLKCECGAVEGAALNVSPRRGNHVVCCCRDCQDFAEYLGSESRTLDLYGGTDIYQTSQSQIQIHKGHDNLRALRLTPKGLLRWHTSCCNTPVGNSINGSIPFFGIIHTFIDEENREQALGPLRAYCQVQDAASEVNHPKAHPKFPISLTFRIFRQVSLWKIQGKHKPSPFFKDDGNPVAQPFIVN